LTFLGTNTVYDSISLKIHPFAEDGPFRTLAKNVGMENHEKALHSLIATIQGGISILSLEKLGEAMWSHGHPMKFVVQ
jgi:hypothetical protein